VITGIGIQNFKRFRDITVPLRALTVLTGLNGTGKSTLIQAILLARQAAEASDSKIVALNGVYGLALGESEDILHPDAEEQIINIRLEQQSQILDFKFRAPEGRSLNLGVEERPDVLPDMLTASGEQFCYLNAERLGPRDQLGVTAEDIDRLGVGEQGQYTAQVLAAHESKAIDPRMIHPSTEAHGVKLLRTQVEMWASDIIRPIEIVATWLPGVSASTIRFREPGLSGAEIRPGNTGFGFSYALPIIVAGLRMKSGGLFLVENPEAHLHPAGQSKIGGFLARLAANNVQVVIETHSDHILNGIRLAVANGNTIQSDEVVVHFFGTTAAEEPTRIDLRPRGSLSSWPLGFFDQIEQDLGRLARAR